MSSTNESGAFYKNEDAQGTDRDYELSSSYKLSNIQIMARIQNELCRLCILIGNVQPFTTAPINEDLELFRRKAGLLEHDFKMRAAI